MERIENFVDNIRAKDWDLNDLLTCELRGKSELWLHVEDVRERKIGEKISLLKDGFKKLADKLKSDKDLENVKTISGTSWIIGKNPKLLERLGFTVAEDEGSWKSEAREYRERIKEDMKSWRGREKLKKVAGLEPGHARISREHFIELYGGA